MDLNTTSTPMAETSYSRTLKAPSDNPLRQTSQTQTPGVSADDGVQLIRHFRKLEHIMAREIRAFWDINFLKDYLSIAHIPRGLRIKKFPTSELSNDDLKKEWTDTLDTCSFKLINILIASKTKEIEVLQSDMSFIQSELASSQNLAAFTDLDSRLSNKLDKMEKSVIASKRGKMARDKNDYENNKVYTWKRPVFSHNRSRRNRGKQVSFSDQESDLADNSLARTMSDSSLDRSIGSVETNRSNNHTNAGNPCRSGYTKRKKSSIKKQEGAAGDTRTPNNSHYSLRGKMKK